MKKIIILSTSLLLTFALGQKQIPGDSGEGKLFDERSNGKKSLAIDTEMIQDIRKIKSTKEKTLIKKQIMNAAPNEKKSFKVLNSDSKFMAIKKIIDQIKSQDQTISSEKINTNKKSTISKDSNKIINYKKGNNTK
ncbi:hypothetical protein HOA87_08435 [bacterium]|nr:hypothetical protein [bacterium]